MKFNSFELVEIATKKYPKFEKEGPLYFKDISSDGINCKKGYAECYGKLKGNILFIFKAKEKIKSLYSLLILERFNVQLIDDDLEPDFYHLLIEFESGFDAVQIGSKNESERDSWLSHIYIASYECMRIQLINLQQQIGHLSNSFIDVCDVSKHNSLASLKCDETYFEVSLNCLDINLKYLFSYSNKINTFAEMFIKENDNCWKFSGRTEIVENTNLPTFNTSIGFNLKLTSIEQYSIKFVIHHVVEMMTATNIPVAFSILSFHDILKLKEKKILNIKLLSYSDDVIGSLIIKLNTIDSNFSQIQGLHYNNSFSNEILDNSFCNSISHTFYFKNNAQIDIRVVESLKEFSFAFSFPESYLRHKIEQERMKIKLLQNICLLDIRNEDRKLMSMIAFYESIISTYEQHRQYLHTHLNDSFKASSQKTHKEVLFVPTNLHLQSLNVSSNLATNTDITYNVVTVGVFTPCALKYKYGGLHRLYQRDSFKEIQQFMHVDSHLQKFVLIKRNLNETCMRLCSAANLASIEKMSQQLVTLHSIIEELTNECMNSTMNEYVSKLLNETERSDSSWKWNGTDLVKSDSNEPWILTCTNNNATLMYIINSIEQLLKTSNDTSASPPPGFTWLETIGPSVIKLQRCVEFCCETASSAIIYNNLISNMEKQVNLHTLKQRKDAVMSQALTSVAAGLACFLNDLNSAKLAQIKEIGLLNQFECLLSCHGDEKGMLEDMMIAILELEAVKFSIHKKEKSTDCDSALIQLLCVHG